MKLPSQQPSMPTEYLISFGRAGHIGRFQTSVEPAYHRGDRVVVRGVRGTELGQVLGRARQALPDPFLGELLRPAGTEDEALCAQRQRQAQQLCQDAEAIAGRLHVPLAVLDAEVTLDGRGAVLHVLSGQSGEAGPVLDQLAEQHGMIVRLYDLASEAAPPADAPDALEEFKCDKPDCGEGRCDDCGDHGGCSSCSAGGAKELESYFAELRAKMEAGSRVPLA